MEFKIVCEAIENGYIVEMRKPDNNPDNPNRRMFSAATRDEAAEKIGEALKAWAAQGA